MRMEIGKNKKIWQLDKFHKYKKIKRCYNCIKKEFKLGDFLLSKISNESRIKHYCIPCALKLNIITIEDLKEVIKKNGSRQFPFVL